MILESPGHPATIFAPSIQSAAPVPTWFSRWVNTTTWEVSKSTRPTRIMGSSCLARFLRPRLFVDSDGLLLVVHELDLPTGRGLLPAILHRFHHADMVPLFILRRNCDQDYC